MCRNPMDRGTKDTYAVYTALTRPNLKKQTVLSAVAYSLVPHDYIHVYVTSEPSWYKSHCACMSSVQMGEYTSTQTLVK